MPFREDEDEDEDGDDEDENDEDKDESYFWMDNEHAPLNLPL